MSTPEPVTMQRLEELEVILAVPSYVPGPLDLEDIRSALVELIGHRHACMRPENAERS